MITKRGKKKKYLWEKLGKYIWISFEWVLERNEELQIPGTWWMGWSLMNGFEAGKWVGLVKCQVSRRKNPSNMFYGFLSSFGGISLWQTDFLMSLPKPLYCYTKGIFSQINFHMSKPLIWTCLKEPLPKQFSVTRKFLVCQVCLKLSFANLWIF